MNRGCALCERLAGSDKAQLQRFVQHPSAAAALCEALGLCASRVGRAADERVAAWHSFQRSSA